MPISKLPNNYIVTTCYDHDKCAVQTRVFVDNWFLVEDRYIYLNFNDLTKDLLHAAHKRVVSYIEQLPYAEE